MAAGFLQIDTARFDSLALRRGHARFPELVLPSSSRYERRADGVAARFVVKLVDGQGGGAISAGNAAMLAKRWHATQSLPFSGRTSFSPEKSI
jgi:hypothetical protein